MKRKLTNTGNQGICASRAQEKVFSSDTAQFRFSKFFISSCGRFKNTIWFLDVYHGNKGHWTNSDCLYLGQEFLLYFIFSVLFLSLFFLLVFLLSICTKWPGVRLFQRNWTNVIYVCSSLNGLFFFLPLIFLLFWLMQFMGQTLLIDFNLSLGSCFVAVNGCHHAIFVVGFQTERKLAA